MDRLCSAIVSFIAWASYRIAGSVQAGNDLAQGLALGGRVFHNLSMRSKQTLKANLGQPARSTRRPPPRPRLRAAEPTGPTGSATRDRLVPGAPPAARATRLPGHAAPGSG